METLIFQQKPQEMLSKLSTIRVIRNDAKIQSTSNLRAHLRVEICRWGFGYRCANQAVKITRSRVLCFVLLDQCMHPPSLVPVPLAWAGNYIAVTVDGSARNDTCDRTWNKLNCACAITICERIRQCHNRQGSLAISEVGPQ